MTTTLILAGLVAIAAAILIIPLLRRPKTREGRVEQELAGYRAQLAELGSEVEQGRIGVRQAQDIRAEVRRKILSIAKQQKEPLLAWKADPVLALILVAAVMLGSGVVYTQIGSHDLPDQPLAARVNKELIRRARNGDTNAQISLLTEKLNSERGNFEDWWTLASLLRSKQRFKEALIAMQKAAEFKKDDWQVQASTAEMMVLANNGKVNLEAKTLLELVSWQLPNDFRSHYYLGLHEAQEKNFAKASKIWLALLERTPDKAPWLHRLRVSIADMAREQKLDPLKVLPEKHAAIYQSSPDYQLVQLQSRVKNSEKDIDAWLGLARMYAKYGNKHQASGSLAKLQELFPGDARVKERADRVAKEFKLSAIDKPDMALGGASAPSSRPHEEGDTQALEGMVSSLASKLKEDPDNLSGWQMLIRSYTQLNKNRMAKTALDSARQTFSKNKRAIAALQKTANELGISSN